MATSLLQKFCATPSHSSEVVSAGMMPSCVPARDQFRDGDADVVIESRLVIRRRRANRRWRSASRRSGLSSASSLPAKDVTKGGCDRSRQRNALADRSVPASSGTTNSSPVASIYEAAIASSAVEVGAIMNRADISMARHQIQVAVDGRGESRMAGLNAASSSSLK